MGLAAVTWLYLCGWDLKKWLELQAEWVLGAQHTRLSLLLVPATPCRAAPVPGDASHDQNGSELGSAAVRSQIMMTFWNENS
jgi:hypothetical protein